MLRSASESIACGRNEAWHSASGGIWSRIGVEVTPRIPMGPSYCAGFLVASSRHHVAREGHVLAPRREVALASSSYRG